MTKPSPEEIASLVTSAPLIKPLQIRSELAAFARLVADLRPRAVLQIGTHFGGTLCILSRLAAPDAAIISVDLPGGALGGGYDLIRGQIFKAFPSGGQKLYLIRDDSHKTETEHRVRRFLNGRSLDLLFIDGDHTYEGVRKDFQMYSQLVRPGGMIALYDIGPHPKESNCEVDRFWQEVKDHTCRRLWPIQARAGRAKGHDPIAASICDSLNVDLAALFRSSVNSIGAAFSS